MPNTRKKKKFRLTYKKKEFEKQHKLVAKFTKSKILQSRIKTWGTHYRNKFYPFHSNINLHEGIFINLAVKTYLQTYKPTYLSVLEIGCAYGMSSMFMLDALNETPNIDCTYTIIDPNQNTQWNGVGMYNILETKKSHIHVDLIQKKSDEALAILEKQKHKFDIVFIDGGHGYEIVLNDSQYTDLLLKPQGLVIHDDVLHTAVNKAISEHYTHNALYHKMKLIMKQKNTTTLVRDTQRSRKRNSRYKSYLNPLTMYMYQKQN